MAKPKPHWAARAHPAQAYRSGLEDRNAKFLKSLGEAVLYETLKVPYRIPEAIHHYHPDFRLANGILVETKGLFLPIDRAKHLFVRVQYPELDLRMVFTRSATPLYKGGKSTYADWCKKHGILYADKLIPIEWTRETGPLRPPEEVLRDAIP